MENLTGILILLSVLAVAWYYSDEQKKKSVVKKMVDVDLSQRATATSNDNMQKRVNDLTELTGYDSYDEVVKYMGVEREVINSHNEYSNDINREAMGPSLTAERDDPNDVVPWVGLRRTNYRDVYSADNDRGQISSEGPDQMAQHRSYGL